MSSYKVTKRSEIEKLVRTAYCSKYCSMMQRLNGEVPTYKEIENIVLTDGQHKKKFFDFLCECSNCCRIDLDCGTISLEADLKNKTFTVKDIVDLLCINMKKYGSKTEEEWYESE